MTPFRALLAATAAALAFIVPAQAATELSCQAKRNHILRDMEFAKAQGQTHRLKGLQQALEGVDENCTDEGLREAHRRDVEKKRAEVAERERDLREAEADGDPEKIARRKEKLAEEQAELEALLRISAD